MVGLESASAPKGLEQLGETSLKANQQPFHKTKDERCNPSRFCPAMDHIARTGTCHRPLQDSVENLGSVSLIEGKQHLVSTYHLPAGLGSGRVNISF